MTPIHFRRTCWALGRTHRIVALGGRWWRPGWQRSASGWTRSSIERLTSTVCGRSCWRRSSRWTTSARGRTGRRACASTSTTASTGTWGTKSSSAPTRRPRSFAVRLIRSSRRHICHC
uniref:(northern house mosquito) hypothetical protein n=1 Tax=Culex pipiens TaxID=7175 RepID=A0A8D8PEB4_CULPI